MKTEDLLKNLKSNPILLNTIPLGYTAGLPMLSLRRGMPCLIIPFLKYQIVGEVDKTRVFAPRFVITATKDSARVVKYEDLLYDARFEEVDFSRPIGFFRHSTIKHLTRSDYNKMRGELYLLLDCLGDSMIGTIDFDEMDVIKISRLYNTLLEPSVKVFYHALDKSFFETYIHIDN